MLIKFNIVNIFNKIILTLINVCAELMSRIYLLYIIINLIIVNVNNNTLILN